MLDSYYITSLPIDVYDKCKIAYNFKYFKRKMYCHSLNVRN